MDTKSLSPRPEIKGDCKRCNGSGRISLHINSAKKGVEIICCWCGGRGGKIV